MRVHKKTPDELQPERSIKETVQEQNTAEPDANQVLNMTISEVVEECREHYCCADCKLRKFCRKNFNWQRSPGMWMESDNA